MKENIDQKFNYSVLSQNLARKLISVTFPPDLLYYKISQLPIMANVDFYSSGICESSRIDLNILTGINNYFSRVEILQVAP